MGTAETAVLKNHSLHRKRGEGITFKLAETLKPLGENLSSEIPLGALTRRFSLPRYGREKRALLAELTPEARTQLMAWGEEISKLTDSEKRVLSSALSIANMTLSDAHTHAHVTLGRLRAEPFETLRNRMQMGNIQAALLKEVFGNTPNPPPTPREGVRR